MLGSRRRRPEPDSKPPLAELVDGLSTAREMVRWEQKMAEAIRSTRLDNVSPPGDGWVPQNAYIDLRAEDAAAAIESVASRWKKAHGRLPTRIRVCVAPLMGRLWSYLELLDKKGRLSPVLWVRRGALKGGPPWRRLRRPHQVRFFNLESMAEGDLSGEMVGTDDAGLAENPWWNWETRRAGRPLRQLSESELLDQLDKGQVVAARQETQALWTYRWFEHPVVYADLPRWPRGKFPFPELDAVPFYLARDAKRGFEMIMQSYPGISLLEDVTDKQVYTQGWIRKLRDRMDFPREETRGRRRGRGPGLVDQVGKMVNVLGLPKYRVAKELGIPRSTVYWYLRKYGKRKGHGQ